MRPVTVPALRGFEGAAGALHELDVALERRLSAVLVGAPRAAFSARAKGKRFLRMTRARLRALRVSTGSVARRPRLAWLIAKAVTRDSGLVRALFRDLLRLGLLDAFQDHQLAQGGPWRISPQWRGDTLVLCSHRNGMPTVSKAPGAVRRIVWEHSLVSPTALLDPGRPKLGAVRLGDEGDYEFKGLCGLVLRDPMLSWDRIIAGRSMTTTPLEEGA
jgi:hypothetical protein